MNKKIITTLKDNEDNFNTNTVIQINGTIYTNYISSPSHELPSEIVPSIMNKNIKVPNIYTSGNNVKTIKIQNLYNSSSNIDVSKVLGPTVSKIIGKNPILETGYFLYDRSSLLDKLSDYGEKLYKTIGTDKRKQYIQHNFEFEPPLIDKFYINIEDNILEVIIDFFKNFGFPFDNKISTNLISHSFPYYMIETKVIPSLLLIYIVNKIYNNITFLETKNLENYEKRKLNNITNQLYSLENLLYTDVDKIDIDFEFEEDIKGKLSYFLEDYKTNLLDMINHYSNRFSPIQLHTYFDYTTYNNTTIPISENLLELVWYICKDRVLSNFGLVKTKKCLCCGKKLPDGQLLYCSEECRKKKGGRNTTKNNKKNLILEILEKCENYIFADSSINKKLLEFQELKSSRKIDNIDDHDYLIKELKSFKQKIDKAILDKKYKSRN